LQGARAILDSPANWNRADNQVCDAESKTVSLFSAVQMASKEVNGAFDNSGVFQLVEERLTKRLIQ
jgi:hypothetical protein